MFSRLLSLNMWLSRTCSLKGLNYIDNFNLFWRCREFYFRLDGIHLSRAGVKALKDNLLFALHHPSSPCTDSVSQVQPPSPPPAPDHDERSSNTLPHVETQNTGTREPPQLPPLENATRGVWHWTRVMMTCITYQRHYSHQQSLDSLRRRPSHPPPTLSQHHLHHVWIQGENGGTGVCRD